MSTFAFSASRRVAIAAMISATSSAAIESPWSNPARTTTRPISTITEPAASPPKCSALARSAGLPERRATRSEASARAQSTASAAAITAIW